MAKYKQGYKDRRDEHLGMERLEKRGEMDSGYMGMIHADYNAPANLPQHVVHKYYGKCEYMDKYELDDSIRGVDDNLRDAVRKIEADPSESMY